MTLFPITNRGGIRLTTLLVLASAALAGVGGYQVARKQAAQAAAAGATRKIQYYQSPMHPWIKSDQPGNCTICGMKLVPIYEGEAGVDEAASSATIRLSKQTVSTIQVETTPVSRQALKRTIRVAGVIDDDDSAHRILSAYVDGRVDKLHVNFVGAEVEAGQPLAAFYSRDLLVARSEYTLASRMAPGPDRESAVSATRRKLQRMGLTSEQLERLAGQTGDTIEIVAPAGGTVVKRNVYEGQYVKEGDVLFEIANFSKMWFVFDVYERDLAWIRMGQQVDIATPSVPGKIYRAPVAFIDPNLTPETRAARVRVVLDNPIVGDPEKHRHELLHKVYATGSIQVESQPVLAVPRSAILSPGGEPYVYVSASEGAYELRRVLVGRASDDLWEIVDGVKEGERVVTTGNLLIDAQAQLDQVVSEPSRPELAAPAITDAQAPAAMGFADAVAAVSEALAADDLARFNQRRPELETSAGVLADALGKDGERLRRISQLPEAPDLVEARRTFYPISMLAAEYVLRWRKEVADLNEVKVFECPMAKSAVPSAETNTGRWIQAGGPLRNPYFGSEMLQCGEEVRP